MAELRGGPWVGAASLLAVSLILAALFPPFVTLDCPGCSAPIPLVSGALGAGSDAWAVLWIAGVLAVTATLFLVGMAPRFMAGLNAIAALAALGLSLLDGVTALSRVLHVAVLAYGYPVNSSLGPGYYLFVVGGATAVVAAVAMLRWRGAAREEPSATARTASQRAQLVAGGIRLAAVLVAVAGAFFPFATTGCGDGDYCFFPALRASFSSALVATTDGRVVVALLLAAGIAMAAGLAGRHPRLFDAVALLLALTVAALVSFDSLNAGTRVLGWPFAIAIQPAQGYYLLQIGSATAAVLSWLAAMPGRPRWPFHRELPVGPLAAAKLA